jgi:hypothetical protein
VLSSFGFFDVTVVFFVVWVVETDSVDREEVGIFVVFPVVKVDGAFAVVGDSLVGGMVVGDSLVGASLVGASLVGASLVTFVEGVVILAFVVVRGVSLVVISDVTGGGGIVVVSA